MATAAAATITDRKLMTRLHRSRLPARSLSGAASAARKNHSFPERSTYARRDDDSCSVVCLSRTWPTIMPHELREPGAGQLLKTWSSSAASNKARTSGLLTFIDGVRGSSFTIWTTAGTWYRASRSASQSCSSATPHSARSLQQDYRGNNRHDSADDARSGAARPICVIDVLRCVGR
ncbi:hypothetical protein H4696_009746 [Amycolatopsis lexingtonensis]|uniref:Uncharacterized protein n=1 Tax=Amycolatopsis lexingtonensis TaxID=218822 RepID=A0ABR9IHI0_9PSEU|nr:hypothetical protein [Amycolatopsis lexingtonensis]MBE1502646.1 hypothetical protein [Amycolatopsis lexingtonensis]